MGLTGPPAPIQPCPGTVNPGGCQISGSVLALPHPSDCSEPPLCRIFPQKSPMAPSMCPPPRLCLLCPNPGAPPGRAPQGASAETPTLGARVSGAMSWPFPSQLGPAGPQEALEKPSPTRCFGWSRAGDLSQALLGMVPLGCARSPWAIHASHGRCKVHMGYAKSPWAVHSPHGAAQGPQ